MKKKIGNDWCLPRLWAQAFHTEGTKHDIFGEKTERNPRLSALSATSAARKPRHRGIMGNKLPDLDSIIRETLAAVTLTHSSHTATQ